jgi:hypothetical protein
VGRARRARLSPRSPTSHGDGNSGRYPRNRRDYRARDGKGKHKIPPTYARAEECARSLYGRRDDDGLDVMDDDGLDGIGGVAVVGMTMVWMGSAA